MEEDEGRERGRKLLVKRTTRSPVAGTKKKGQGLLTRRDRARTRTIVCGEREDEGDRDREESAMMNARYS